MTDDTPNGAPSPPPIRPMSRRSSRAFVLVVLVAALLLIVFALVYLTRTAKESARQPEAPSDTTGVPPRPSLL